jgi:hypothetical protein
VKEWQAVMKRVEGDKLHEEQEGRANDKLSAEHRRGALEKTIAKLQVWACVCACARAVCACVWCACLQLRTHHQSCSMHGVC